MYRKSLMKKKGTIFILILALLLTAGCGLADDSEKATDAADATTVARETGAAADEKDAEATTDANATDITTEELSAEEDTTWSAGSVLDGDDESEQTPAPEGWEMVEGFSDVGDAAYLYNASAADGDGRCTVAETEDRVYICGNSYIYMYDKETEAAPQILCSRPDCRHTDAEECPAYAGIGVNSTIQYYEGNLYTLLYRQAYDGEGEDAAVVYKIDLYQVAEDGSGRTYVQTLVEMDKGSATGDGNSGSFYARFIINSGYVYYWYDIRGLSETDTYANGSNCLYRVKLGENTGEECVAPCASSLRSYGEYIYFLWTPPYETYWSMALYRVCPVEKRVEYLTDLEISSAFTISDGEIYYWDSWDDENETWPIYLAKVYDIATGEDTVLCDFSQSDYTIGSSILTDGDYWYVWGKEEGAEEYSWHVYDMECNLLGVITQPELPDNVGTLTSWELEITEERVYLTINTQQNIGAYYEKDGFAEGDFTVHMTGMYKE
ncbi:MAG: hypothetical protein LUE29_04820 [Lachnospiraceae bacterium]|nr:hypothetical protein [Lachnospiraceae bacterium]